MSHTCHVKGCDRICSPAHLMCRICWSRVPEDLKAAVHRTYRSGQEQDKSPSIEWIKAARAALNSVRR